MLLEALLFRKVNHDFWDLSLVAKAVKEVAQESQNARYEQFEKSTESIPFEDPVV